MLNPSALECGSKKRAFLGHVLQCLSSSWPTPQSYVVWNIVRGAIAEHPHPIAPSTWPAIRNARVEIQWRRSSEQMIKSGQIIHGTNLMYFFVPWLSRLIQLTNWTTSLKLVPATWTCKCVNNKRWLILPQNNFPFSCHTINLRLWRWQDALHFSMHFFLSMQDSEVPSPVVPWTAIRIG